MTHLMKLGPAKPYEAQTQCGIAVSTMDLTDFRPSCPACAEVYDRIEAESDELLEALCRQ